MIVCLDTAPVIWGIERKAAEPFSEMIPRTEALLRKLDEDGKRVIIPTPVLWEFLTGVPAANQVAVLAVVQRRFRVPSFDARAAKIAADLWQNAHGLPPDEVVRLGGRNRLKVDCQIAAIAISCGATVIYSHDQGMPRMAGGRIQVSEIPRITEQGNLFTGTEGIR